MNLMKKWKPMFQNFLWGHPFQSRLRGRWRVALITGGGGESKSKNGFFTIYLVDQDISGSIFIFEIILEETEILQFVDFGRW